LRERVQFDIVGHIPQEMMTSPAALDLGPEIIRAIGTVNFVQSLEAMYDADILLLIEADVRQNLFLPSKLSDYLGSATPLVGIVPPGASEDAFKSLGAWHANPRDIDGISRALEGAIDHVSEEAASEWCDTDYQRSFSGTTVAQAIGRVFERF